MAEPLTFFASFMVSLVGFALFIYGKRQKRLPQVMAGLLLGVAVGIGALTALAIRGRL